MTTHTARPTGRQPVIDRAAVARACGEAAVMRRWWAVWPALIAAELAVAAPALHWVWHVLALPDAVQGIAAAVAITFAAASTLDRRAGWPRTMAALAYAGIIGWGVWVWYYGPNLTAYRVLGWALVAAWPVWLWHRWWRDRQRYVQVAENRWERRAGAPDPGLDRIGRLVGRWRKRRQRASNRRQWHQAQRPAGATVARAEAPPEPTSSPERERTLAALDEIAEPTSAADVARWTGANRETVRRHLVWLTDHGQAVRTGTDARPLYAPAST